MLSQESEVICASADEWRRLRLSNVLEHAGYHVRTCATARELLQLAANRRLRPDDSGVLLLDIQLSEQLPASTIVSALRRSGSLVRTVVLAEQHRESEIIECLRVGADDFVHFPADPSEVIDIVGRVFSLPDIR